MRRISVDGALLFGAVALLLAAAACGRKAPLRLPDDRAPEQATAPRARIREGRVTLDFQVPRRRMFPEREAPWVLARILRRTGTSPGGEVVEAGAILETDGFAFGAPLSWADRVQPAGTYVYHVEFRDGARRRRALSGPVTVAWERVPGVPLGLSAVAGARVVALSWDAPGGAAEGMRYRVYRREKFQQVAAEAVSPETVSDSHYVDSRVEPGREYCYAIRAVIVLQALEVEGAAGPEACARAAAEENPPARPPGGP